MGFGIYSAISGAKAREMEMEVIANNLSNLQTAGFKEMAIAFEAELNEITPENDIMAEAQATIKKGESYLNFEQGGAYRTDNPLDFAIQGDGFFAVQTEEGTRYTRNGSFVVGAEGVLQTNKGHPVLTSAGSITVPHGQELFVTAEGDITVGDEFIGKLQVVDFLDRHKIKPTGNNLFNADGLESKESSKHMVLQGHLENSNVNLVSGMTRIIQVSRSYEALQKSLKNQIDASKMLNQLAKMG